MRVFAVLLLLLLMPVAVCFATEADDWFGMVEFQVGPVWNVSTQEWAPVLTAPVGAWKKIRGVLGLEFDFDEETEAKGPIAGLFALTYDFGTLADHGAEKVPGAKYVGLNVGPFVRKEFGDGEFEWGIMATVLDFSFGDGNVKRHKER